MKGRRSCAFCQRQDRKISGEHAWPLWIRELLASTDAYVVLARHARQQVRWPIPDTEMGVKVNAVCKPCNEGWMSDLETAATPIVRPLVLGHTIELTEPDLETLARWAVKTAMVFDLVTPLNGRPYYTDEERSRLRASPGLPDGQPLVWLAGYVGANLATAVDHRIYFHLADDPDRSGGVSQHHYRRSVRISGPERSARELGRRAAGRPRQGLQLGRSSAPSVAAAVGRTLAAAAADDGRGVERLYRSLGDGLAFGSLGHSNEALPILRGADPGRGDRVPLLQP